MNQELDSDVEELATPTHHSRVASLCHWLSAQSKTRALVAILLVSTIARLLYWRSTASRPLTSDAGQYHEIAANLANGRGFVHQFPQFDLHPTAFRPPLYPFILSVVYRVFGPEEAVGRAFSVVVGVAVVLTLFLVLDKHCGRVAAVTGATLVAVYPPLIANDTVTLTEGVSLLLLVLLLDAAVSDRWLLTALYGGLLTLARPSAQFLILVLAIWLFRSIGWRRALAAVGVSVLVVAPWVVRNYLEVGTPVVVSSNGFNLAAMYSVEAQNLGAFVDPVYNPGFNDMRLMQFNEADWDGELQRRALENIRRDPTQVLTVMGRNFLAMSEMKPSFNRSAEELDGRNMEVRVATMPFFYIVSIFGVVGLFVHRRQRLASLAIVIALYFMLASLVFVSPPRLRAPIDLMLCIGVGLLVGGLPERSTARGSARESSTIG